MCRPVSHGPRYRARLWQMPECSRLNAYHAFFGDPNISRHWVVHTRLAAFNLRFAAVHFQMTDYLLEVKSRWARTTTPCLLTVWCVYPARACVVRAFQLANNRHFMIVSLLIFACQVMNPSEADFVVGGIRVNTFSTTWNMLRLWQCKGSRDQGGMRWQASWMLQTSEPETFAAECACKRDKQVTIQVLPKASSLSLIKQERSECSVDTCCDWCHSLPAEIRVFRHQITTPAAHRCKSMAAPSQLEHGQDSSSPPHLSDTRPYWPRKHDVQSTFKAKSLHETSTWTSRDIEIISKTRWSEPELGELLRWPCRDSSGFLNLHGNRTIFSASDLAACEASIYWILFDLLY